MGLNKPIIITTSAVDTSNLATKSDMTTLQNSVNTTLTNGLSGVGGAIAKIQKGIASFSKAELSITLSGFTDLSKMVVHFLGSCDVGGDNDYLYTNVRYTGLTLTKLTVNTNRVGHNSSSFNYEVIQYK